MPGRSPPMAMVDGDRWAVIRDRQTQPITGPGERLTDFMTCMGDHDRGAAKTEEKRALLHRLRRRRALARAVLLFERVWPAVWPPLGIAGAFVCAALLELPATAAAGLHLALLVATGAGHRRAAGARPARRSPHRTRPRPTGGWNVPPGLHHRPLAVLADRPARPEPEGAVGGACGRATARSAACASACPGPDWRPRPHALRGLLVVALVACAGDCRDRRPCAPRAFPGAGLLPPPAPPATELQAWITPPAYTRLAPVFLKNEGGAVSVPAGSQLTVNVTGGSGTPSLALAGANRPFEALDATSFKAEVALNAGGRLAVRRSGRELAAWALRVVADRAPMVSWPEPPGPEPGGGRVPQTRLPWQVSHDYGVTSLNAELHLRDRPDAPALVVPIPLPGGNPKSARGVRVQDLTAHPWAGLAVIGRLVARNSPGLAGTSAEAGFVLPERRFENPIARALMAIRKQLTLDPDDRLTPVREIGELSALPEVWDNDIGGFLNLTAVASLLHDGRGAGTVDTAQGRLWELAIHLEEGATARTAQALEQARQALREALDAQKRGEKVDPAEIDRRMQAVEEALQKHLQALAEQARRNADSQQFDPDAHRLDTREMQRLAEQMRQAAQAGDMDTARDKLAELEKMLDELKNLRPEQGRMAERERERAQQRQRGQQQMNALQDVVQRLGTLLDHAESRVPALGPGLDRP